MTTLRDPLSTVNPGDVLGGKFRVERVLGEGGMGVVAAATHLKLGQTVALKFMLPAAMKYPENLARFEREARAAVRLKSDHVARVSDVGHLENGAPYIVMEYLEGEDLDAVVERGRLPIETSVDYVLQACEAVAEAHTLGIVHRDLKLKNLFLTKRLSGKPLIKVLDFGISKSVGDADLSLTSTTQVLGSPNYMSPEQLRSARDVDHRTDIWALGVILHELLTGQVPFLADSVTQLTVMVLEDPPRAVIDLRPEVPAGLAEAIAKCLEKKPENRFQNVNELARAIAPFASADGMAKATELLVPVSGRPSQRAFEWCMDRARTPRGIARSSRLAEMPDAAFSSPERWGSSSSRARSGMRSLAITRPGQIQSPRRSRPPLPHFHPTPMLKRSLPSP